MDNSREQFREYMQSIGMSSNQDFTRKINPNIYDRPQIQQLWLLWLFQQEKVDKIKAAQQQSAGEIAELNNQIKDSDECVMSQAKQIVELKADNETLVSVNNKITSEIVALEADNERLREALQLLHDDIAEYQRINNIGGYDNHTMKNAREALSATTSQSLQAHNNEVKGK